MKRWEYTFRTLPVASALLIQDVLNEEGKEGWEFINMENLAGGLILWFKREVIKEKGG